jgi:DNA-binding transcriptional ArsR family regulator
MAGRPRRAYISPGHEMEEARLRRAVEILKALAHPARLRILGMLVSGELCVCQVTSVLGLAVSTVSAHLAELRRAGLVTERKSGRFVRYRLAEGAPAAALLDEVWELAALDSQLDEDAALVHRLRGVPLPDLCQAEMDLRRLGLGPSRPGHERRRSRPAAPAQA